MPGQREPWYSACCRTLTLRRHKWKPLDEAWEEQSDISDASETGSTKSGTPVASAAEEAGEVHANELGLLCCNSDSADDDDEDEFFSDADCNLDESVLGAANAPAAESQDLQQQHQQHQQQRQQQQQNFGGRWMCTETWGLDDFLKRTGVSRVQRMAASRAPWPEWRFQIRGQQVTFVNRSALGDLREEFTIDGSDYDSVDGWKQVVRSKAYWETCKLIIDRAGPQGRFREERWIDSDGKLQFRLSALGHADSEPSWGRIFERKGL